jgi:hypothetical protein
MTKNQEDMIIRDISSIIALFSNVQINGQNEGDEMNFGEGMSI